MWQQLLLCCITTVGVLGTPHETGCGCTTTTTCQAGPNDECSPIQSRPGKRGPIGLQGPKGNKGEPMESDENRLRRLQEEIDDLKAFQDVANLYFSFPKSCSQYIAKETEIRRFDRVPIYPGKADDRSIMLMANCTKLPELINPRGSPVLEVPRNSLLGRTLVLKARASSNRFSVNFMDSLALPTRYYFHIVADKQGRYIARNDYLTKWNTEERDLDIPFPFTNNALFTMRISIDDVGFHVELNGSKLLSFKHRQRPYDKIAIIRTGGMAVEYMSFN